MSIRQGNKVIAGHINYHPDLFDHKWADHMLNDISWLRADTFSWQDGGVYEAAYNHLVDDLGQPLYGWSNSGHTIVYRTLSEQPEAGDAIYVWNTDHFVDSGSVVTSVAEDYSYIVYNGTQLSRQTFDDSYLTFTKETIAGTDIYFYQAADGHKICPADQESNVASIYSATGVAWYYIIDTVNQRFKLPRINPVVAKEKYGTIPVIGNGMTLGLTNGSTNTAISNANANGYMQNTSGGYGLSVSTSSSSGTVVGGRLGVTTDSANSGIIADTTQQSTIFNGKLYLYFYVGNFTQTALENTAGLNASLFNDKADIDLTNAVSNASTTAKETIVGWGMPDYSAPVSLSWNTTYTATEDCMIYATTNANTNAYIELEGVEYVLNTNNYRCACFVLIAKGQTYKVYGGNSNQQIVRFPLKGV